MVGVLGGRIADRFGLRRPLATSLVLVAAAVLTLLAASHSLAAALGSAVLFGAGFTMAFALLAMGSQQLFHDHPTTGFTLAIVCGAAGFIVGPSLFGVLATRIDASAAILAAALPALLAGVFVYRWPCSG